MKTVRRDRGIQKIDSISHHWGVWAAVAALLPYSGVDRAEARQFPTRTGDLNGTNGFTINGDRIGGLGIGVGFSTAGPGDFNGDGLDEALIGTGLGSGGAASPFLRRIYMIFGTTNAPATVATTNLSGQGVVFTTTNIVNNAGGSLGRQCDFNGDGYDDAIIGTPPTSGGQNEPGGGFVVLGRGADGPALANNNTLEFFGQEEAVRFLGEFGYDTAGRDINGLGDVNGDGIEDIGIAANRFGRGRDDGAAYVVFGSENPITNIVRVAGTNYVLTNMIGLSNVALSVPGIRMQGVTGLEEFGVTIDGPGDVNGDGRDDILVGGGTRREVYLVYGSPIVRSLRRDELTSNGNGFLMQSTNVNLGFALASRVDLDGDGLGDIVMGVESANSVYVVWGATNHTGPFEVAALDGTNGFKIEGELPGNRFGISVEGAGDVNGDGLDDLIIGADKASALEGKVYVLFGRRDRFPAEVRASTIRPPLGFSIVGSAANGQLGFSVAGIGDFNGDGFDDMLMGAYRASQLQSIITGAAYVIFGTDPQGPIVTGFWPTNGSVGVSNAVQPVVTFDEAIAPATGTLRIRRPRYNSVETFEIPGPKVLISSNSLTLLPDQPLDDGDYAISMAADAIVDERGQNPFAGFNESDWRFSVGDGEPPSTVIPGWVITVKKPKFGRSVKFKFGKGLKVKGQVTTPGFPKKFTGVQVQIAASTATTNLSWSPVGVNVKGVNRKGVAKFKASGVGSDLVTPPSPGQPFYISIRASTNFAVASSETNQTMVTIK